LAGAALNAEELSDVQASTAATLDGQQGDPAASIHQPLDVTAASNTVVSRPSARMEVPGAGMHSYNHVSYTGSADNRLVESYGSYLSRIRTGNGLAFGEGAYSYEAPIMFATSASFHGNLRTPGIQIPLHNSTANRLMSPLNATELIEPVSAEDDDDQTDEPATTSYTTEQKINWLQDYAVYNMRPTSRKNKFYWQMYITPDENVRMLSGTFAPGDKIYKAGPPSSPKASASRNAFSKLLQNMGFATGASILYKLTPTLSIKGGLQFNYSRFAVDLSPARAATGSSSLGPLANAGGLQDSAGSTAGVPTPVGHPTQILYNEYFQLSAPVGLELRVWGNDRLQVNVAATVQPAYMLNGSAYLPAAEGNNYVQSASLFRKWNIDAGAEAYISYRIGGFHLQVGPDFRYQFLSSYINRYPIRENLASYGLKIGIIKAIR
jgi:hypothetical protein